MRFAYADPPYPGQAKRLYGDHPDYAGEVDHAELITRLAGYDGWALSTSVEALQSVLALCPGDVRVAVWNVTNRRPWSGRGRWHQSWEPVIVWGGRPDYADDLPRVRDLLSSGALADGFPGKKPRVFGRWVFDLLGARPDDELDDLFPGSGIISNEWTAFQGQQSMSLLYAHAKPRIPGQGLVLRGHPTLDGSPGRSTSWRR